MSQHFFDTLHAETASAASSRPAPATQGAPTNGDPYRRDRCAIVEDEITKLTHRVFILPGAAKAPRIVAFCGVGQGAGCSWVCTRTSEALAKLAAGTVCAVDANLRSPSLDTHFQIDNGPGFADAMKGPAAMSDFARRVRLNNLWVLTAGSLGNEAKAESNGASTARVNGSLNGTLNPARLREKFLQLRNHFDYVIVDTPPVDSYGDALLLGQLTDGIVLVVGSHMTRRESARIAKESFDGAAIPVIGAVLNKRTFPIPEALYRIL